MINTNRIAMAAGFIVLAVMASIIKAGILKTVLFVIPCAVFWAVVFIVIVVLVQWAVKEWRRGI